MDEVTLGAFLPDAPDYNNPGLIEANNVLAAAKHYKPLKSLVGAGVSVSGEIRGAFRFELPDETQVIVVGTTTDLFVIKGGSVTASGLGLSLGLGEYWSFDQFKGSIYATTKRHGFYRLPSIFTDSAFVAPLGDPPKAVAINVVGDFLVAGNLEDIDATDQPYRVRWSGFNNPEADWVTDIARQSGYVDMPTRLGRVTSIYGGTFDLIFQARGVSRIWYTGGPSVFGKKEIDEERGCTAPNSIVRVGSAVFFVSHDGFCRSDGSGVEVVSSEIVWDWFTGQRDTSAVDDIQGAVDWSNRSIVWTFKADGTISDGMGGEIKVARRQIIYNWVLDRWTTASISIDWLTQSAIQGVHLDADDPAIDGDADLDIAGSFDDVTTKSKGREIAAFRDGELAYFTGPNLEATFETGDFQLVLGRRAFVRSVTPIAEAAGRPFFAQIAGRDYQGDAKQYTSREEQGPLMFCPVVSDARYQSVRLTIPAGADWNKASGFLVDWSESGYA